MQNRQNSRRQSRQLVALNSRRRPRLLLGPFERSFQKSALLMIIAFGEFKPVESRCDSKDFARYARTIREYFEREYPAVYDRRRELSDSDFVDDCSRQQPQVWQLDPGETVTLSMEMPDGEIWTYCKAFRNRDGSMLLHHASGNVEALTNEEYLVEAQREQRRQNESR